MMNLTEEQRMEIRQLIETMRRNGASREEINEAVLKRLEEYGIDVTHLKINRDDDHFMGRHRERILDQLTEEQKTELLQKIKELRESGATRNEIRDMTHEQLKEWGIETPECQEP
jgi:DNA-binding transcriptional regulator YhcF (GntR family)